MTAYDQQRLASEIAALSQQAASATAQGKKLQDLVEWLFGEIDSATVTLRNKHDAANTEEKDLWVNHSPWISRLPFFDVDIPIECKNEAQKSSSEEVTVFGHKIAQSGGRDGILVCRSGLAGTALTSAHAAIRDQLGQGVRIVVLTAADLATLGNSTDLVARIVARHTELRTEQTYKTI